ncbi:MAG: hypothetical protein ACKVP7_13795 [Hyphomicrobiaceae bacterium]
MRVFDKRFGFAGRGDVGNQLQDVGDVIDIALDQEALCEPTFSDAILDRLVHNPYRLNLKGPSMRKPDAAETTIGSTDSGDTSTTAKPVKGGRK